MSGAEPYVLIEQLRVDQRVLSERVLRLEQNAQQGQHAAPVPHMPSPRQAARVVPSVRSMPRPAVPPVPPIAPRGVQQPAPAPAAASLLPRDLSGFLGALGSILAAPDASERLVGLADRLQEAIMPLVTSAVRDICPELLDPLEPAPAAAESTLPPVPPIVPASPAPAPFSVAELGFSPSSVIEFTQVDGPGQG